MSNKYWNGKELLVLNKNTVKVKKLNNPKSIGLMNHAFKVYYDAMRMSIKHPTKALSYRIKDDVQDAGYTGAVLGGGYVWAADLDNVFKHVIDNNGMWTQDQHWTYFGKQKNYQNVSVPHGVNNFLQEIDSRGDTLITESKSLNEYLQKFNEIKGARRWKQLGEWIGNVDTTVDQSSKILWIWPKFDAGRAVVGKWTKGTNIVHSAFTNYMKYEQMLDGKADRYKKVASASVLAAMTEVIRVAVPIFGDFYAKAIEAMPTLVAWAEGIVKDRDKLITQAVGPEYRVGRD